MTSTRRPRTLGLPVLLLALACSACTGEIGGQADGLAPDGAADAGDLDLDQGPVEPDFGEITMTPELCETAELAAGIAPMRLLTRLEYDNTVRDLLGASPVADAYPPENLANGFENAAYVHVVSPLLVRAYLEGAEAIAAEAVATRLDALLPCDPAVVGEFQCADAFVRELGPRAFRRPLDATELAIFQQVAADGLELFDFEQAIAMVIEAMLQSPQFLYRIELQDAQLPGELVALSDFEVASRLSYFLWSTMPDTALFEAAERGELSTAAQVEAQARTMLADPRANATIRAFYRQWLDLRILDSAVKDTRFYPGYAAPMNEAWQQSVLAFVEHVYGPDGQGTLAELLTSPMVFLSPELAPLYGVGEPVAGMTGYAFDPAERAGLLTQPGVLATLANPDQSSPILRGVFVREKLLCQPIKPPPNDMAVVPPDPDPNATTRERFAIHTESDVCASCHSLIDPIGFGLEDYDGIGAHRTTENDLPVDASGYLAGVPTEMTGEFEGGVGLALRLADGELVGDCLSQTWFRYALGRAWGNDDACSAFDVEQHFRDSGGDLRELLVAIVISDTFRYRRAQLPLPGP